MRYRFHHLILCALFAFIEASLAGSPACHSEFRNDLETRALRYFLEHAHPVTGLVRDRARNFGSTPELPIYRVASIAATGFGLAVVANAAQRKLIPRAEAIERVRKTLNFARHHLVRFHGWFFHFVNWENGMRAGSSEISTVDTAFFIAGALYAAYALASPTLIALADDLYEEVDFVTMMTDGGTSLQRRTLSMGWQPESGYLPWQWNRYAEHVVMILLGLGQKNRPLPLEAWGTWRSQTLPPASREKIIGAELPLFAHQYSHLFFDFRRIADSREDLFDNSRLATMRNWEVCASQTHQFATYGAGFWGLSASDSVTGYQAFSPAFHNGTVCPGCVGGSAMFYPCPILSQLKRWASGPYRARVWGYYGFADSLNLEQPWVAPDVIGITAGALYLSLANTDTVSIWKSFHFIPAVQRGFLRAYLTVTDL